MTSETGTDIPAGSQGFYHHNTSPQEARRLEAMARMRGDRVSFDSVRSFFEGEDLQDKIVLDIGAGDSTSLGEMVVQAGGHYVPTDIRSDAVARQRERFPHAMVANVVDLSQLGELGQRVDVVHGRAVFGWLRDNQRTTALAALVEQAPNARLTITDYDWTVAKGPAEYMTAIQAAMGVLQATGFQPDYGARATEDLTAKMREVVGPEPELSVDSQRDEVGRDVPISEAMPVIDLTASALIDQLKKLGMRPYADYVEACLGSLEEYATNNPDELVSLPDLVTTRLTVASTSNKPQSRAIHTYRTLQGVHEQLSSRVNSLPLPRSGLAKTEHQRLIARRVQAAAYFLDGIISSDGIRHEDGTLIHTNDPLELVDRSDYVVTTEHERVMAVIRMIKPLGDDPRTLPTVQRLESHAPQSFAFLQSAGVFKDGSRTLEVSALARNPFAGETKHVFDAIISLAYHANRQGYDHAIMGLQERHVPLITSLLGPKAIHQIPASDAVHPVQLPCVAETLRFVALYSDVKQMLPRTIEHTSKKRGAMARHIHEQAVRAYSSLQAA